MKSTCSTFWKCEKCGGLEKKEDKSDHECGEGQRCRNCCKKFGKNGRKHLCYMRAAKPQQKKGGKFIYFDFEARVDHEFTCAAGYKMIAEEGCVNCTPDTHCTACKVCVNCKDPACALMQHVANYAIAQSVCDKCTPSSRRRFQM